jgi:hypothetical protein
MTGGRGSKEECEAGAKGEACLLTDPHFSWYTQWVVINIKDLAESFAQDVALVDC